MVTRPLRIKIVVVGASWGGIEAATQIFSALPETLPVPVVLVQHQRISVHNRLAKLFETKAKLKVVAPEQGELLEPGRLYVAPPGYHTMIDEGGHIALGLHRPVLYCRPAIDELFFSAGQIYGRSTLAVLLTGANEDGAAGMRYIKQRGGMTVVQDPATAEAPVMPESAIKMGGVQHVVPLANMADFICEQVFGLQE